MTSPSEQTHETQRSICASYAKDIIVAIGVVEPDIRMELFDKFADHIHNWVTTQPVTFWQKTKIFELMDLKKIASKEDLTIREHLHEYTHNDAVYLIGKLSKEVYGNEVPAGMTDYLNSMGAVMKATAERSERDDK